MAEQTQWVKDLETWRVRKGIFCYIPPEVLEYINDSFIKPLSARAAKLQDDNRTLVEQKKGLLDMIDQITHRNAKQLNNT